MVTSTIGPRFQFSEIVLCGDQSDALNSHPTAPVDGIPFPERTSRYPIPSCWRRAAALGHVFPAPRGEAMATTAPLLSPQRGRATHLPRRLPAPPLAFPLNTPARLRPLLRLRGTPPPCGAKFGKFDASDAPAEAEEAESTADGGVTQAQPAEEDDR